MDEWSFGCGGIGGFCDVSVISGHSVVIRRHSRLIAGNISLLLGYLNSGLFPLPSYSLMFWVMLYEFELQTALLQ
jgi:hypothetical protein